MAIGFVSVHTSDHMLGLLDHQTSVKIISSATNIAISNGIWYVVKV